MAPSPHAHHAILSFLCLLCAQSSPIEAFLSPLDSIVGCVVAVAAGSVHVLQPVPPVEEPIHLAGNNGYLYSFSCKCKVVG